MAEDLPASDPKPRRRSLRGILRWLVRFLTRSAAIVAGVILLVAVVASVLYLNRVRLLNRTLDFLVEPFRVTVDEIDFTPLGTVRIENLRLAPKSAPPGSLLASIPETVLTYRIAELKETGRFENLTLRGATVMIDDTLLAAMASAEPETEDGEAPAKEPFLLSRLALFTGTLAVEESRFLVDLDALPRLEGTWAFRSGSLDFEEAGLSRTPFAWRITDLAIGPEGSDGRIAALSGEGRVSADLLRLDLGPLRLERPVLRLTPSTLPRPETKEGHAADPPLSDPAPARSIHLRGIEVIGADLSVAGFDGADGGLLLPDFSFETSFSLPDLSFAGGRWESDGPLALVLMEAQASSGGLPFLSAASIHVEADSLQAIATERRIAKVALEKADLLASNETLARFLKPKAEEEVEDEASEEPKPGPPSTPWVLETVEIRPSAVLVRDLDVGGAKAPELSTAIRGTLRDLRFGGEAGFASEGAQSILLEQTRLRAPGAETAAEPLLSMERVELEGRWSDFQRENIIERLVVRGPKIEFTDAALGDWLRGGDPAPDEPRPIDRPVYKAKHLEATGGRLVADSSFATGRVPKVHAGFSLETKPPHEGDPFSYRLQLDEFAIRNHARSVEPAGPPTPEGQRPAATATPLAEGEVFRVAEIEVDFTAAGLQRTRRIDKLKIDGAVLTVGEGLKSIAGDGTAEEPTDTQEPPPSAAAPATPTAPKAPPPSTPTRDLPAWTLGEVEITRSRVHFESLIPQVEGLQFAIETKLTDLPLSLDGILAQEAKQKIELAGIVIKDPYDSFITVAELPTIFVEFSLAGLARQEVERIDLVGPSLHVGQGLFWWVDYQRRFREQNEGASIGIESDAAERKPDWVIKTINATAGKIVISPTGVPIGVVPFPFNATTNMSDGDIELKLTIPDENHIYRFPDYKVELEGLAGDVQFNVPVKDLNNNLVQTFSLRRAKWKDFDAKDLYITATFDENGIYGNFGGEAYAGYAEGGFNFYLTDRGKWDAWVAGTNLDTGPVTKILVPDSFLMEGKVSLKVVSEGRDKTVGETTGEFQTTTPGWFDITKLDTVFEKLPPEWSSLQRSLTELSLVALKRFDYDKGAGSLYFLNRAGKLELRFTGDYGSRELNLHVHDQRNTNESAGATAPEETPRTAPAPPAADARPAGTSRFANALKSR